jgi:hypothetical protein
MPRRGKRAVDPVKRLQVNASPTTPDDVIDSAIVRLLAEIRVTQDGDRSPPGLRHRGVLSGNGRLARGTTGRPGSTRCTLSRMEPVPARPSPPNRRFGRRSSLLMCTAAEVSGAASVNPTIPNRVPAPMVTTSTTTGWSPSVEP